MDPPSSSSSVENLLGVPVFESVKWIAATRPAKSATSTYGAIRESNLLMILFAPLELFLLSIILFVTQLPWPEWFLDILYQVDTFIVETFEKIIHLIGGIWNYFVASFRILKQFVEDAIDFCLSICIFFVVKIGEVYTIMLEFAIRISKIILFPWIQMAEHLISQYNQNTILEPTPSSASVKADTGCYETSDNKANTLRVPQVNQNQKPAATEAAIETESESDHSTVSDYNMKRQADLSGRPYKRINVNVAPEGRLREELFKHVRGQLKVMRKNSIRLSRDIATQAKQYLEPKLSPIQERLYKLAEDLYLVSVYEKLKTEIFSRPILAKPIETIMQIVSTIVSKLTQYTQVEKKSKKSRSSRSESLKRRNATVVNPPSSALGASVLLQSAEPTTKSETVFPLLNEVSQKTNENLKNVDDVEESKVAESNGDSAFASSIDDIHSASEEASTLTPEDEVKTNEFESTIMDGNLKTNQLESTIKDESLKTNQQSVLRKNSRNLEVNVENKLNSNEKKSKKNVRYRV